MIYPPKTAPLMLPMPPSTAAMNDHQMIDSPTSYAKILYAVPYRLAATVAMIAPNTNEALTTRLVLIPINPAAIRSCDTARIATPSFVLRIIIFKTTIVTIAMIMTINL